MERVEGIEPSSSAWKAEVIATIRYPPQIKLVEGGGFEPPKLTRQIYSLIPLATREPLRTRTVKRPSNYLKINGAGGRNRTPDLRITSALLYRLSYTSPAPSFREGAIVSERIFRCNSHLQKISRLSNAVFFVPK